MNAFRLALRFAGTGFDTVEPSWKSEPHVFQYNRMFLILDGEGYIEVDSTKYYPSPGSLVRMPAGTT
jgi:AraC family transcriptional regulator of arabinose operon